MADAVRDISRIDATVCREHVRTHFSPAIMAAAYVRVYEQLADRPRLSASPGREHAMREARTEQNASAVA
jgi:hypothetical protein